MKPDAWWEAPLRAWAPVLGYEWRWHGIALEGDSADPAGGPGVGGGPGAWPARPVGQWRRQEDEWRLSLGWAGEVAFPGWAGDAAARSALAWTLRQAHAVRRQTWREAVCAWAARVLDRAARHTEPESDAGARPTPGAGHGPWPSAADPVVPEALSWPDEEIPFPACLACLRTDGDTGRAAARDVLTELVRDQVIGWIAADPGWAALLVIPLDGRETKSGPEEARRWLRQRLNSLLDVLAADAWVPARVAAGAWMDGPQHWHWGMTTLAAAVEVQDRWRQALVYTWGEDPVGHLLQQVGGAARSAFLAAASQRAPDGVLTLSREMVETLEGMVSANLNVSEASRLLYLHRNTLMNRIERIRQQTGYDVRTFQDALVLWLASRLQASAPDAPRR
ncbi:PucR family transcriptional regulator [Alicyclobacillus macrosporangiidus]|uniref:PucR C-terminal helix-turn-helix domain-containing protein n=1 Tax=Alicyclobacillus macrosporangiidus TaxID=392015 RepID=A0A1I7K1A9_9BACL|nr:helix-turn-helix domain-containing protein [Alicyclobacillus macrosporangiidus]SFU91224.1 PucR C-terminal helix-turn-helix domain-containing protein [Alicyclobacillus macrosporangiidus]